MTDLTAQIALEYAVRFCVITRLISTLELLVIWNDANVGLLLNCPTIVEDDSGGRNRVVQSVGRFCCSLPNQLYFVLTAIGMPVILFLLFRPDAPVLIFFLISLLLLEMGRYRFSYDGADEMSLVVLLAAGLGLMFVDGTSSKIASAFLAAEVSIAYFAAGAYKIRSKYWQDWRALLFIIQTKTYGHSRTAVILRRHPVLTLTLTHGVILWQCLVGVSLVAPRDILIALLLFGICFHLACAFLMGLNTFLWAFVASYPSLIYVNQQVRYWLTPPWADLAAVSLVLSVSAWFLVSYAKAGMPSIATRSWPALRLSGDGTNP
jgi:hypothetical protein